MKMKLKLRLKIRLKLRLKMTLKMTLKLRLKMTLKLRLKMTLKLSLELLLASSACAGMRPHDIQKTFTVSADYTNFSSAFSPFSAKRRRLFAMEERFSAAS